MSHYEMYINGKLINTKNSFEVKSPATLKTVGTISWASKNDALNALKSAQKAFDYWSNESIENRIKWMLKLREEIIKNERELRECIHNEMGKNYDETKEDYDSIVNSLKFYADEIQKVKDTSIVDSENTHKHKLVKQPVGIVVAFLAWNFPLLNLAFKIGPAMASGCPIIIKPSKYSPLSAFFIGKLCEKISLPKGVVNFICGENEEVGHTLSNSHIPALITLIGSNNAAKQIMKEASSSIKRYSMELGGNAPAIVCEDADISLATNIISALKFTNAGQICVTPNRVFVHKKIANKFKEKLIKNAMNKNTGFENKEYGMGPLIDQKSWNRVNGLVKNAIANGASLIIGGNKPKNSGDGYFYAPTILDNVNSSMKIYNEEIFGPIISIIEYENEEEVIKEANNTDAGLSSFIFTEDEKKANTIALRLRFAEVQINGVKYAIYLPHGGIKQSGIGYDCSYLALDDYLYTKRITSSIKN